MESDSVPLLILDGKNYVKWRLRMQCILEVKGLDKLVYGNDFGPTDAVASGSQGEAKQVATDEEFIKKNARAKMLLVNAVDDKHSTIIMPCKSARDIWSRLESEYSDKAPANVQSLLSEYYSMTMSSSHSASEYIAKVDNLVERLSEANQKMSQEAVMAKIVSSLPAEYNNFRRTWEMIPEAFKNKAQLIANLKKEEASLKQGSSSEALLARSSNKNNRKRPSKKDIQAQKAGTKCKWCGTIGHWWSECPSRPEGQLPEGVKRKSSKKGQPSQAPSQRSEVAMTATFDSDADQLTWYLDSGASEHMSSIKEWLEDYKPLQDPRPVKVGNGDFLYAIGKGSIRASSTINGKIVPIRLRNVYYVPKISSNLFSVGAAARLDIGTKFVRDKVILDKEGTVVATGSRVSDGIYKLNIETPLVANIARVERTSEEWHRALGHAGVRQIEEMARSGCVEGMKIVKESSPMNSCGDCQLGRGKCASHPTSNRPRASEILERVHVDLVGPINPTSLGGSAYFVTIKDEFSSYLFVKPVASKADVGQALECFFNEAEALTQTRVKIMRSDNGSEFKNQFMTNLCYSRGIVQEFSAAYTPEQNGEAERANRVLLETATSMINASALPLEIWPEAVCSAAYVRNRIINSRTKDKTPFEMFFGRKPNLAHLVAFGQEVHIIDHSRKASKFSPKTIEAHVIGYGQRVNTYRCLIKGTKNIRVTSDVVPAKHKQQDTAPQRERQPIVILGGEQLPFPLSQTPPSHQSPPLLPPRTIESMVLEQETYENEVETLPVLPIDSNTREYMNDASSSDQQPASPYEETDAHDSNVPLYPNLEPDGNEHVPSAPMRENAYECTSFEPTSGTSNQHRPLQLDRARPIRLQRGTPTAINRQAPTSYFIDFGKSQQQNWRGATLNLNRHTESLDRMPTPVNNQASTTHHRSSAATQAVQDGAKERAGASQSSSATCHASLQPASIAPQGSAGSRNGATTFATASQHARSILSKLSPSREKRQIKPRTMMNLSAFMMSKIPVSYDEAVSGVDKAKWLAAINAELSAHKKNCTWDIVSKPANCKEITAKWVFRIKDDGTYKARLVARGFTQIAGVDYGEIFAPVVRMDSVRLLFAVCAQLDLVYAQFDITTAFLYGNVEEDLFMSPPAGLNIPQGSTLKLRRSLYGLKQAPRCWNNRFTQMLTQFNMKQSQSDPCVFLGSGSEPLYLALYVDDGLIFAKSQEKINTLIDYLTREFEVKLIRSNCFLGVQIIHDKENSSIYLHQRAYIERVIDRYGMTDSKPSVTPIELNHPLNRPEVLETDVLDNVPYPEVIGSLLYCAMGTRPDISYAMSVLSKYSGSPRQAHWEAAKRVIRYLKSTINHGLVYRKVRDPKLVCYTDADWAGDHTNRRSVSGMITMINTGPISYHAQQQPVVATSTTEAEYIAASVAAQEMVWLKRFLTELKVPFGRETLLRCDNQSAIKLIKNPEFHKRTKHIEIRFHYIREQYYKKLFKLDYVQSDEQRADVFTKALTSEKHRYLCDLIGCIDLAEVGSKYRLREGVGENALAHFSRASYKRV